MDEISEEVATVMKKYFETKDFYNVADIFFKNESYNAPIRKAAALARTETSKHNIEHVEYYALNCLPDYELFSIIAVIKHPKSTEDLSFRYLIPFTETKAMPTKLQTIVDELNEQLKKLYYEGEQK